MTRIEQLTPEQEAKLPFYREKWQKIGLCTDPCDRDAGEKAVAKAYTLAGLTPPRTFIWVDSPYQGVKESARLLRVGKKPTRADIEKCIQHVGFGLHDANWLGFFEVFWKEVGFEFVSKLEGLMGVAQTCGWWWPFERACVISERPDRLLQDDQHRLHCEDGPAIRWPDGWSVYCWHDILVDRWIIEEPEKITVTAILNEKNTERRRVMRHKYGTARFLEDAGAEVISEDKENQAKLMKLHIPDDPEPIVMVQLHDFAPGQEDKVYYERVPPYIDDCRTALAWRMKIEPKDYKPKWQT